MRKQREPGWAPSAMDLFATMTWLNLAICGGITLIGSGICFLVDPKLGWGFLLGSGIATVSVLVTLVVMIATEKLEVRNEVGPMAGSYLVKALLILVVLSVLYGKDFYSPTAFGLSFLLALVANLAVDMVVILRSRG